MEAYPGVSSEIAVIADPANMTELCGTHEDILIPSSCLNATVSGLISRTFYREDIIGTEDFHGAAYYGELVDSDLSYGFIEAIEKEFLMENPPEGYVQREYESDMGSAYACADLVLSRAGSNTVFELLALKKPAVLVQIGRASCRERV